MFGGYGKTAQRRYQVSWSPHIPAVVGTCSFDRKVQLFTMNGASTSNGRAPKWHRRPAGASFAFGGRLVSYSSSGDGASTQCQQVGRFPRVFGGQRIVVMVVGGGGEERGAGCCVWGFFILLWRCVFGRWRRWYW